MKKDIVLRQEEKGSLNEKVSGEMKYRIINQ